MESLRTYRAPWSSTVKSMTYITNAIILGIDVALILLGIKLLGAGQTAGWAMIVGAAIMAIIFPLISLWAPKSYSVSDKAVLVNRRIGTIEIPFSKIAKIEIMDSNELFRGAMRVGSGGLYGVFGQFYGGVIPSFRAYVTNDGAVIVIRLKGEDPVVISPETPDEFAEVLSNSLKVRMETKTAPKEERVSVQLPSTTVEKVFRVISGLLLISVFAAVAYFWGRLPQTIPMHFGANGEPDGWGSKYTFLILPAVAVGVYALLSAIEASASKKLVSRGSQPAAEKNPMRLSISITKCWILGVIAYTTWQIGFTSIGVSKGLGSGFTIFMVLSVPVLIIVPLIALSRRNVS